MSYVLAQHATTNSIVSQPVLLHVLSKIRCLISCARASLRSKVAWSWLRSGSPMSPPIWTTSTNAWTTCCTLPPTLTTPRSSRGGNRQMQISHINRGGNWAHSRVVQVGGDQIDEVQVALLHSARNLRPRILFIFWCNSDTLTMSCLVTPRDAAVLSPAQVVN